jgi:hypothetical protein
MLTPAQLARADQIRAALRESLVIECDCGHCPTDEQIRAALALDDESLLRNLG